MEENNKLDNNTNGSLYSSSLYGTEPQPQTGESENSSVYGQQETQPDSYAAVQTQESGTVQETEVTRESDAKQETEVTQETEIKVTTVSEISEEEHPQNTVPVSLEKPSREGARSGQSCQSANVQQPGGNQQGFYGQPVNPNPVNINQMNYGGQPVSPVNGNQINYNGQPNYSGQPMNPNQMGYNGQPNYYGQPMNPNPVNANQMNYGGQPMNQGLQYAVPKKSKTGLIIGITAAAVVIIVAAIGLLMSKSLFGSAEKQLAKGMLNMTKEMEAYSSSISEDIGIDELKKLRDRQPMHTNIDFSFTDPNSSGSFDNVSIEIDSVSDSRNKQGKYDLSVGTYGFDMDIGSIIADSNMLYFSSPLVFKEDVYSLDLTNLGRDFNNSAWAELLDNTLPEDYSFTWFEDNSSSPEQDTKDVLELGRIIEKYTKNTAGSVKYAVIKEKREFPYGGTLASYGGVQVTVDKEAYNEAMENLKDDILSSDFYANYLEQYRMTYGSDFDEFKEELDYVIEQFLGLRFEQDVVLNFYLDKKGRIINISTPEDIAVSSPYAEVDSIAVDIDFGGSERTLDSIEGGIYMQSGDEILYLGISRTANVTDDYYSEDLTISLQSDSSYDDITFYYGNDWGYSDKSYDMTISVEAVGESISLTANGGFEDIVKGEGYTFRINNATLSVDDENLLILSGVISMEPADGNKIEVPESAIDILKMSESDITAALYKALYSIQ